MPWANVKRNSNWRLGAVLIGLAVFLVSGLGSSAYAVSTEIGAKVCGENPTAAVVQLTQPNDDSVVSQPVVTVRGGVESSSQVVIEIDGEYNNTVAIASNQTVFSTDVTLVQGTHTITVTANEICGGQDGTDQIAMTYEPAVQPSSGEITPTIVEPAEGQTGVVISGDPIPNEESAGSIESIPVIGGIIETLGEFASSIGLASTIKAENTPLVAGAARVGLTVVAVTSVVMASSLAPLAVSAIPGVSEVFQAGSHRSMVYLEWVIRGIGVLAMAIAYFI